PQLPPQLRGVFRMRALPRPGGTGGDCLPNVSTRLRVVCGLKRRPLKAGDGLFATDGKKPRDVARGFTSRNRYQGNLKLNRRSLGEYPNSRFSQYQCQGLNLMSAARSDCTNLTNVGSWAFK